MGGGVGGGGYFGGGGHVTGAGYPRPWRQMVVDATGQELKERGIAPQTECNCLVHIVITVLVCAVIFMFIWEIT